MSLRPAFFVALRNLAGRMPGKRKSGGQKPGKRMSGRRVPGGQGKTGRVSGGLWGAVLGIAMSLVPLVLVMTVSDGMIQGITNRYIETSTYHIQAAFPSGTDEEAIAQAAALFARRPGVRAAYAEIQGVGVVAAPGGTQGVAIRAPDGAFFTDESASRFLEFGPDSAPPVKDNEILLGKALAEALGVGKGSVVTLMTQGAAEGASSPRIAVFRVCGSVSAGYRDLDALWAFVTPHAARRILAPEASRTLIGIKTVDAYSRNLNAIREDLATVATDSYPDWFEPGYVRTWQETERSLFRSFSTTKTLLSVIMALAVLVAAVNLSSALGVFVAERRTEIAVLRGFGTSDKTVRAVFLAAGTITGLAGTAVGLCLGSLAAWRINDIIAGIEWIANAAVSLAARVSGGTATRIALLDPAYYLERIPVELNPVQLLSVAGASLVLCILASILPARRAGAMTPMELLRKT